MLPDLLEGQAVRALLPLLARLVLLMLPANVAGGVDGDAVLVAGDEAMRSQCRRWLCCPRCRC
eukprot:13389128-Alexandrium_andersonii.AAC.1